MQSKSNQESKGFDVGREPSSLMLFTGVTETAGATAATAEAVAALLDLDLPVFLRLPSSLARFSRTLLLFFFFALCTEELDDTPVLEGPAVADPEERLRKQIVFRMFRIYTSDHAPAPPPPSFLSHEHATVHVGDTEASEYSVATWRQATKATNFRSLVLLTERAFA